uniref:Uncharacterized protein n=1 Tax=Amphimedon queenslandica TaxID=400682 RepID=A0A1X7SJ84_AMPQE
MAANERPGVVLLTLQLAHILSIVEYQEQSKLAIIPLAWYMLSNQGCEYPNCAF